MSGWRFAFSKRWAGYLAITIIFAIACAGLAMWQLARRDKVLAEIALVQKNFDRTPAPVAEVLPTLGSYQANQEWTPVLLTGSYLVADQLLVRNRPFNGSPGFEVLTPLLLDNGSVFIIDRGWLPTGNHQDAPDIVPVPPAGQVTVTARVKAGEPNLPGRSGAAGQIATIQLNDIANMLNKPTYTGAYGLMATESPATATRPTATPKPAPDEGPHLSYAFQWFVFGLMAFIGLGWAVRQEYRLVNAEDPDERERAEERARRRAARPRSDSEIEDELVGQFDHSAS
ncbi:MAG: SURF1 family cytochrome oxidase biogenesis protein [Lacisediminihabitans sp.]